MRIAISSERRLFRDALATCLAACPGIAVVGHVSRACDLLDLCALRNPDVVLFEIETCGPEGLEALRVLRSRFPDTTVVMAYDKLGPDDVTIALRSGVDTLVPFSHGLDTLVAVLRDGAKQTWLSGSLTDQDQEILALIGGGHPVDRIASLLGVSTSTVENTKRRIRHRIGQPLPPLPPTLEVPAKSDGVMLVLLRGVEELMRDYIVPALLTQGIPFVIDSTVDDEEAERWNSVHNGPVLLVLADPAPDCWPAKEDLGIPVALVRRAPMGLAEVLQALDRGASAIIAPDRVDGEDLVSVLNLAANGHVVLAVPHAATVVMQRQRGLPHLTAREGDILRSIACGHTVRQTARSLGIAEKTVENIQARLFRKLGAHNRPTALIAAEALGLIDRRTE